MANPHEQHGALDGQLVDDPDGVGEGRVLPLGVVARAVGADRVGQERVEGVTQVLVILVDDLTGQTKEQDHVLLEVARDVELGERARGERVPMHVLGPLVEVLAGEADLAADPLDHLVLQTVDFGHCNPPCHAWARVRARARASRQSCRRAQTAPGAPRLAMDAVPTLALGSWQHTQATRPKLRVHRGGRVAARMQERPFVDVRVVSLKRE